MKNSEFCFRVHCSEEIVTYFSMCFMLLACSPGYLATDVLFGFVLTFVVQPCRLVLSLFSV